MLNIKDIKDESRIVVELNGLDEILIGEIIKKPIYVESLGFPITGKGNVFIARSFGEKIAFTRLEEDNIKNIRLAHNWEEDQ